MLQVWLYQSIMRDGPTELGIQDYHLKRANSCDVILCYTSHLTERAIQTWRLPPFCTFACPLLSKYCKRNRHHASVYVFTHTMRVCIGTLSPLKLFSVAEIVALRCVPSSKENPLTFVVCVCVGVGWRCRTCAMKLNHKACFVQEELQTLFVCMCKLFLHKTSEHKQLAQKQIGRKKTRCAFQSWATWSKNNGKLSSSLKESFRS